jgi:hypothetical protein
MDRHDLVVGDGLADFEHFSEIGAGSIEEGVSPLFIRHRADQGDTLASGWTWPFGPGSRCPSRSRRVEDIALGDDFELR